MKRASTVPVDYPDKTVCILGLGFVGLTLATVMADIGFEVIGVEIRDQLVAQLSSGDPYFFEPDLSTRLKKVIENKSLRVSKKIPKDCNASVYIITAGTPLDENKIVNLSSICNICNDIAEHLQDGALVILRSTVKLGTTRNIVLPILQKTGKRFEIAFCPERTVEGQAMAELRYLPQVIGADDLSTSIRAAHLFQFLTPTVVRVSDMETAEMIKLIDNTKRDVIFGFSNEVARLCDAAGLSASEVLSAGRFGYARTDLPTPGPVGGPCLSKDSYILAQSMEEFGVVPQMTLAARRVNEEQSTEVTAFLKGYVNELGEFPKDPIISLLGIAFKGRPATDDLRGTTAKPIFEALKKAFPQAKFWGYDPVVNPEAILQFGLEPKTSVQEALKGAHLALILNNHPVFAAMPLEKWSIEMARPGVIYDFWNNYSRETLCLPPEIEYISLGSHKFAVSQPEKVAT